MPRKAKKTSTTKKLVAQPRKAQSRPIWALLFFTAAVMCFVAVWDFELAQSRQYTTEPVENLVGVLGAEFSFWSFHVIGVATWLMPIYLMWIGVRFLLQQDHRRRFITGVSVLACLLCGAGLAAMFEETGTMRMEGGIFEQQLSQGVGGVFGEFIARFLLMPYIGPFGTFLVLMMGMVIGSIIVFSDNLGRGLDYIQTAYRKFLEGRSASKEDRKKQKAAAAEAKRLTKQERIKAKAEAKAEAKAAKAEARKNKTGKSKKEPADAPEAGDDDEMVEEQDGRRRGLLSAPVAPPPNLKAERKRKATNAPITTRIPEPPEPEPEPAPKKPKLDIDTIKIISGEKTEKAKATIPERRGDYVFPPINLLNEAPDASNLSPEDHAATMEALVRTLDEFGVKVIPGEIHTGPVITRYEVKPAPGVRVEKIVNLDKNIALGLKAMSVRILAPVPGKGTVGIEVPNKIAQAVCMRDIVESRAWAEAKAEIPIVLGKDVTGKPMVTDLTKMPHVLIAGSTGSGKTVCINAIIASLLYHSGPEDLRFIMVDPKVVEMQMYNALPHMLIPVVTEPKKVPGALKWLLAEMEQRYQIFAKANVRNIAGFNAKISKDKEEQAKAEAMDAEMSPEERAAAQSIEVPRDDDAFEIPKKKLPYIVCIIDELADLMMVAPADIETGIARLAQLARAAGIHLILATQRPSVNVITGVIKANLPSRISFKVASKVDSRTILDGGGAEALIGKGDMLFIPPGTSNLVRAQGAFVSDEEINGIVEFLQEKNEPPVFAEEVQKQIDAGGDDGPTAGTGEDDGDELLPEAIDVLRSTKRASTSMLQRRLRIGYNRAARLMEELEDRGIVGPENGSSPREILVDLDAM
ncbi:DNA translocase FtsK [Coraliomargarita parva]|uniref:DNA translocase FtsK n=1 Tax=Coraliomargarita parva TaxID=3014050 RepID=UPI0022B5E054|nr:DNA translocase FtsK [Coraliomargarita parva]